MSIPSYSLSKSPFLKQVGPCVAREQIIALSRPKNWTNFTASNYNEPRIPRALAVGVSRIVSPLIFQIPVTHFGKRLINIHHLLRNPHPDALLVKGLLQAAAKFPSNRPLL